MKLTRESAHLKSKHRHITIKEARILELFTKSKGSPVLTQGKVNSPFTNSPNRWQ